MEPTKPPAQQKKLWFKAKLYGWGWQPSSWEGWLCLAAYLAFIILYFRDIDSKSHSASDTLINFFIPLGVATSILLAVCYAKGEKPRWRWGK